jgi:hypothetical protein
METSTKYFNDYYDPYESKSCFFKQTDSVQEKPAFEAKLEQPFFTEESFKPDEPKQVVKSFDEFCFLFSTPCTYDPNRYPIRPEITRFPRQVPKPPVSLPHRPRPVLYEDFRVEPQPDPQPEPRQYITMDLRRPFPDIQPRVSYTKDQIYSAKALSFDRGIKHLVIENPF